MDRRLFALAALFVSLAGCDLPRAHGDANAIIVAADPELWDQVSEVFLAEMEPTIQVVTNERPFRISHHDPVDASGWGPLRRFRQVLVIGDAAYPQVAEVLAKLRPEQIPSPPAFLQVDNVWARGQRVSVFLLGSGDPVAQVAGLAPEVQRVLDEQYRQYALTRMYVSGVNQPLIDSLRTNVGFTLDLPAVYRYIVRDSVFRFRNDNPSPAELIREVGVTWISPIPEEDPDQAALESWRVAFAAEYYNDAQDLFTELTSFRPVTVQGASGVEFQSAWVSPPDAWPAGGPFILRAIRCPSQNRLYLIDAWLYAPNREKYEYMIQLQTILDSFRCS